MAMAGNKGPYGLSISTSSARVGRRLERKREKKLLAGPDKGSLTEQQMKQTVTTAILI